MRGNGTDYVSLLNTFEYREDIRDPYPVDTHLKAFRVGWAHGADGGRNYGKAALRKLTWQNLGFRLGRRLGHVSPEEQGHALLVLSRELRAARKLA